MTKTGKTPYHNTYNKDHDVQLLVFGCEIYYVLDEGDRDKFESRSRHGAFIGCGPLGGIYAADLDELKNKKLKTVLTRNFQANRDVMPMREICKEWDDVDLNDSTLRASCDDMTETRSYEDGCGLLRCGQCHLILTEAPVTCKYCTKRRKHPKGRPSYGCQRGRC